jgi:hypothetical protein
LQYFERTNELEFGFGRRVGGVIISSGLAPATGNVHSAVASPAKVTSVRVWWSTLQKFIFSLQKNI